jgi:hypothetical protein
MAGADGRPFTVHPTAISPFFPLIFPATISYPWHREYSRATGDRPPGATLLTPPVNGSSKTSRPFSGKENSGKAPTRG